MEKQIIQDTLRLYKYFKNSKYSNIVLEAVDLCYQNKYNEAKEILVQLPSTKVLLEELVGKLKGKSVYTNLVRVLEGKEVNDIQELKTISSLKTHCIIEAKDRPEYFLLLDEIEGKYQSLKESILNV